MGKHTRQQSASGDQKADRDPDSGDPKPSQQCKQRKRTTFTREQVEVLNAFFEWKQYVDIWEKCHLAHNLGLEVLQVQVWFKNRRAKLARERRQNGNQNPQDQQGASDESLPAQVPCDLPGDPGSCQLPPISSFANRSSVEPMFSGHDQHWTAPTQNPPATYQLGPDTHETYQSQLTTQHINHPILDPNLSTLHDFPPTQQLHLLTGRHHQYTSSSVHPLIS